MNLNFSIEAAKAPILNVSGLSDFSVSVPTMLPVFDSVDADQSSQALPRPQLLNHAAEFDQLWSFFSKDLRKLFHTNVDNIRKQGQATAKLSFFHDCLTKRIIPPSLRIKRTSSMKLSERSQKLWENNIKNIELNNLRIIIKETKSEIENREKESQTPYRHFMNHFTREEQPILEEEFSIRKNRLGDKEKQRFKHKINFLESKLKSKKSRENTVENTSSNQTEKKKKQRRFIKRSCYRRKMKKWSKKQIDPLYINYSDHELTSGEESLLNKHTSFVPSTKKVNKSQLDYDLSRFSRILRLNEDSEGHLMENITPKIFPVKKHNLPSHPPSRTLSNFIYGVESDLLSIPKRKLHQNLSEEEQKGLDQLVSKQRMGDLVIQKTDKGGGIAIMNRSDYIEKIEKEHLQSTVINKDGSKIKVYRKLDRQGVHWHHFLIKSAVKDALRDGIIDSEVANSLILETPREGRAYGMVKAHKEIPEGEKLPPLRLVISGCGSTTENCSHFVDHFTKEIPKKLDSHIQDTPHLLRMLNDMNKSRSLPENAILVTIDVVGLYPNIPQDEGMEAFRECIQDPNMRDQSMPTDFLMTLLRYVLSFNSFSFNGELYLQNWGTAIGTKAAPTYATIFMANLEKKLLGEWKGVAPEVWKRYLDDILALWTGSKEELIEFLRFINNFHNTIKFTAEFRTRDSQVKVGHKNGELFVKELPLNNLTPRSVDFLDTTISINSEGKLVTDLFKKSSDRVTYLQPSSCHPGHICKNIPYSLGYRLKRICSSEETFQIRLKELSVDLQSRGYSVKVIKNSFGKLKSLTREKALEKVTKKADNNIKLTLTYDPRLNPPSEVIKKHYLIAKNDPAFRKCLPVIPRVSYRRARNLGEMLIRSKLYEVNNAPYNTRENLGFTRCNSRDFGCGLCRHSNSTKIHTSSKFSKTYDIKSQIKCQDEYVIYSIQCKKCPDTQYIGQTSQTARKRFSGHLQDIRKKDESKPVSKHFSSRGHTEHDMIFTPFEKLRQKDKTMLNVREKFWINTKQPNLNKQY